MKRYLALGDSMSIDDYTGRVGGGAVARFFRSLGPGWVLDDQTTDGHLIEDVSLEGRGELITLTIGGNNLLDEAVDIVAYGLASFERRHRAIRLTGGAFRQGLPLKLVLRL